MFQDAFRSFHAALNPSDGFLRNSYNRHQHFTKNSNYVKPEQVYFCNKANEETNDSFSYVSIIKTLTNMLQDENVRKFCENSNPPKTGCLFDIAEGKIVQENSFFKNKNILHIGLYEDAFELCNPIGSSKGKFKVLGIYMLLMNLPSYFRSRIDNIKLVKLVLDKNVVEYGWRETMKCIMRDLKSLGTKGIVIKVHDKDLFYKGSLLVCQFRW